MLKAYFVCYFCTSLIKKKRFLKQILLLDNYDSFTYNLEHYISNLGYDIITVRNDEYDLDVSNISHVILSPGPGLPKDAGKMMQLLELIDSKIIKLPNLEDNYRESSEVELIKVNK